VDSAIETDGLNPETTLSTLLAMGGVRSWICVNDNFGKDPPIARG
jgi:hypothetical protein